MNPIFMSGDEIEVNMEERILCPRCDSLVHVSQGTFLTEDFYCDKCIDEMESCECCGDPAPYGCNEYRNGYGWVCGECAYQIEDEDEEEEG